MKIAFICTFFLIGTSYAKTFQEVINSFSDHDLIKSLEHKSLSTEELASMRGSWGDPRLKLAAKNFPKDSLKDDETPMTGVELGVSQKISLTTKYGNIKDSFLAQANSQKHEMLDTRKKLTKVLWEILIERRRVLEEVQILNENDKWLTKILKVTKRLYANGKTSQQALLEIQIRKSEIESTLTTKTHELSILKNRLSYLIGTTDELSYDSIPWNVLTTKKKASARKDHVEKSMQEKLKSAQHSLTAARLNHVPDFTVSLGYTKRSDVDDRGDFVGASISFPLPFSATKYANHSKASQKKYQADRELRNYQRVKERDTLILTNEIQRVQKEINILTNKTIRFAKNARAITAKSYGIGNATYLELLQSELKLQEILLRKSMLVSLRDKNRVALKYKVGEALHE